MKKISLAICSLICLLLFAGKMSAQRAIHYPGKNEQLKHRWAWAQQTARKHVDGNGYWIGYSFSRRMDENSWLGIFYRSKRKNVPQLCEVVYGIRDKDP